MIVSKIYGGLGNQMFQYAVGRALALKLNVEYKLDISDFETNQHHHGYELNRIFNINTESASLTDIKNLLGWQYPAYIHKVMKKLSFLNINKKIINEPHYSYWAGINDLNDEIYLNGYWQSEKYFKSVEDVIRKDFSWKQEMTSINVKYSQEILDTNSVSLHIRRGDYVSSAKANQMHGICSNEYYLNAIKLITQKVKYPHIYIFSDDMEWVKNNFKMECDHSYVVHNSGLESYNDMRLMALCKHNILANSTFSWWAAWLNANPNKIIVTPKKWFSKDIPVSDLIPCNWISL